MSKKKRIPGINVQWPISELIVKGEKTIETRTYSMPEKYIGCELAMIETPGKKGKFKARIVAIVRFEKSFKYKNKTEFYRDSKRHCVTPDSPWKWETEKPKWGWPVKVLKKYKTPLPPPSKRGIVFANDCEVN